MLKDSKQYAIELDGVFYRLSGSGLAQIIDLKDVKRNCVFVTDMQETVSRTMTVEAPAKYAEHIVRKQLQESGDFNEPVSVITHWKKKKGKDTTDVFFTAVPTRLYHAYLDQVREHADSILMFPLYAVLYDTLQRIRSEHPVAVVFQHNRFAELIIGTKQQTYYANRCVAFDGSKEQIAALWDAVLTDINTAEKASRIKVGRVLLLNWIDSGDLTEWDENGDRDVSALEAEPVFFKGEDHYISFPKTLKAQSGRGVISPGIEKVYYYTQKWAAGLNILLLVILLAVAGGSFWYRNKADMLEKEIIRLGRQGAAIQAGISPDIPLIKEYKGVVKFINDLIYYRKAPSYHSVMSDVTKALSPDMKTQILKMDYIPGMLTLEIFGRINAPFKVAHKGYQRFVSLMKSKDYVVVEHRFDTEISDSQFLVKFTKGIR